MATYREYEIIVPATEQELKQLVAKTFADDELLPITGRERLDELTARRRKPVETPLQLEIVSIHAGDDGFVIVKLPQSGEYARIEYGNDTLTLTVAGSEESAIPAP